MTASARHPAITDAAIAAFTARYNADEVDLMTEEQFGDWIDALPLPEFLAMIHMHDDDEDSER